MTEMVKSNIVSRWLSIDNADNNKHEILTGYNHPDPMKKIWQYDCSDHNQCVNQVGYNNVDVQIVDDNNLLPQAVEQPTLDSRVFTPKAVKHKINIICAP